MYELSGARSLSGFSFPSFLKPPDWLKTALGNVIGSAVSGTVVSIPTGTGTLTFDITDAKQLANLKAMLSGIKITRNAPSPGAAAPAAAGAPSNWTGLAMLGVAAFLLLGRKK